MKIKITRVGGYDPRLGPKHPDNQDPTLEHQIANNLEMREVVTGVGQWTEYRWACSCKAPARWSRSERKARENGQRHISEMQKGVDVEHEIRIEPSTVDKLYRWVCTCGTPPGEWKTREFQAQQGGTKHVQAGMRKR